MDEKMSLEKVIEIGTQVGVRTALETIEKIKAETRNSRYNRRLRNTKLLLQNYRNFLEFKEDAIYSSKQKNAVDLLDFLSKNIDNEELYIESIKRSTERTAIILSHIDSMIDAFKVISERSLKAEESRRFKIIKAMYIDIPEKNIEDIAKENFIDVRTVYRDRDAGIKHLTVLLFGIDGLKIT